MAAFKLKNQNVYDTKRNDYRATRKQFYDIQYTLKDFQQNK